jgi:hypothetical protein
MRKDTSMAEDCKPSHSVLAVSNGKTMLVKKWLALLIALWSLVGPIAAFAASNAVRMYKMEQTAARVVQLGVSDSCQDIEIGKVRETQAVNQASNAEALLSIKADLQQIKGLLMRRSGR